MLKSQDSRMVFVFGVAIVFFIIVLGYGMVTPGIMTLWEYTKTVMAALVMLCALVVAVIWAVRGD